MHIRVQLIFHNMSMDLAIVLMGLKFLYGTRQIPCVSAWDL
jgi:hypothetical protein